MKTRNHVVKCIVFDFCKKGLVFGRRLSAEVGQILSQRHAPPMHAIPNASHHHGVFDGVDTLPDVIRHFQRLVVFDK